VPHRHDRRELCEHTRDPQARHVLGKITPVRADVVQRGTGATPAGIEPPGPYMLIGQPILQVMAMYKGGLAQLAGTDEAACLLHERVAAVIESDDVRELCAAR